MDHSQGIRNRPSEHQEMNAEHGSPPAHACRVPPSAFGLIDLLPGLAYRARVRPRRRLEFLSAGCEALTGHSILALRARGSLLALVAPSHREEVRGVVLAALAAGASSELSYPILHASGETRWVQERGRPVPTLGGPATHVEGYLSDVTDQRRAEEERARLAAELDRAQTLGAVGELASGVAHDFNNILTIIRGHTELTRDELDGDADLARVREAMDEIAQAARRADTLTRQLLRIGRQKVEPNEIVRLDETIEGLEGLLRRGLPPTLQLEFALDAAAHEIPMGRTALERVLLNLVGNARDAMPRGGKVRVETATVSSSGVRLIVEDEGPGISAEARERIFEPFFTTKAEDKGSGLGLAVVARVVHDAQGTVRVETSSAGGARFVIELRSARREITGVVRAVSGAPVGSVRAVSGAPVEAAELSRPA